MSANKTAKFARAPNFSTYEEELLVNLVKKYKDILECKITDGTTSSQKNEAWEKLTKEFNCNSGGQYRSADTLRRKYENIKKRAKQKYADEKIKVMGTGGGPHKEVQMSKVDLEVKEILGSSMTGLRSMLDDDSEFHMDMDVPTMEENEANGEGSYNYRNLNEDDADAERLVDSLEGNNFEIITIEYEDDSTNIEKIPNWSNYTPKMTGIKI